MGLVSLRGRGCSVHWAQKGQSVVCSAEGPEAGPAALCTAGCCGTLGGGLLCKATPAMASLALRGG